MTNIFCHNTAPYFREMACQPGLWHVDLCGDAVRWSEQGKNTTVGARTAPMHISFLLPNDSNQSEVNTVRKWPLNTPGRPRSIGQSASLWVGDEFSIRVITGELHGPAAARIEDLAQLKEEQTLSL